jgi:glucose/arabinose dehydrogenase
VASPDGSKLYVGVGSNSNMAENGIEAERERAAIWEVDITTGAHRIYASGVRNPTGLQFEPETASSGRSPTNVTRSVLISCRTI